MKTLDRITWRDGQALEARDLRDDERNNAILRHLHIRYLHRTWGVVEGLGVIITSISTAFVQPGYAIDIEGRELLLPDGKLIAAPVNVAAGTTMYLVISHAGHAGKHCGCAEEPHINPAVLCPDVPRLRTTALPATRQPIIEGVIAWKTVRQVRLGEDVLLARVLVANGQFASPADTSVQRHAASLAQPRIWSDVTQVGQTGWRNSSSKLAAIEATVDTSDAGFTATPAYSTRVLPRIGLATSYVKSASATNFTLVLQPVPVSSDANPQFKAAAVENIGLVIAWFAVELPATNQGVKG
jgi:hypothetical protein